MAAANAADPKTERNRLGGWGRVGPSRAEWGRVGPVRAEFWACIGIQLNHSKTRPWLQG